MRKLRYDNDDNAAGISTEKRTIPGFFYWHDNIMNMTIRSDKEANGDLHYTIDPLNNSILYFFGVSSLPMIIVGVISALIAIIRYF